MLSLWEMCPVEVKMLVIVIYLAIVSGMICIFLLMNLAKVIGDKYL